MGKLEELRAQRERVFEMRTGAPVRLAPAREKVLAPASADGLAGLLAELRSGFEVGETDAELAVRYRAYMASRGGKARAAKLGPERRAEIAKNARKARGEKNLEGS